jgi:hypothetical protein
MDNDEIMTVEPVGMHDVVVDTSHVEFDDGLDHLQWASFNGMFTALALGLGLAWVLW